MFKVGDKFECTRDWYDTFTKGKVYVATECQDGLGLLNDHGRVIMMRMGTDFKQVHNPASRANDPATSKGKRKVNKYEQAVLDILKGLYDGQGYTGKQIASLTGHPLNCITPRFAPLRRKGLIKDSGIKRDKQIVWVLA